MRDLIPEKYFWDVNQMQTQVFDTIESFIS